LVWIRPILVFQPGDANYPAQHNFALRLCPDGILAHYIPSIFYSAAMEKKSSPLNPWKSFHDARRRRQRVDLGDDGDGIGVAAPSPPSLDLSSVGNVLPGTSPPRLRLLNLPVS
jgi:hypothetical protein